MRLATWTKQGSENELTAIAVRGKRLDIDRHGRDRFLSEKAVHPFFMTATAIDKSGERVQRMFGEIAPHYDRMNHLLSLNIDRYWRWWTVKKLAPQAGEPILDVCTGTGDLAIAFQRATRGKSEIVATDFCRE